MTIPVREQSKLTFFTEADRKVGHLKACLMISLTNSWCVTSGVSADRLHGFGRFMIHGRVALS